MGVMQLVCYRLYWSVDPFLGNAGIRSVMTENRFSKLYQFLHLNNNETAAPRGDPNYDITRYGKKHLQIEVQPKQKPDN